MLQSGRCRVLKVIESGRAAHLVADNPQDEGVQLSWGICPPFFCGLLAPGRRGHSSSPFFQGPDDFLRWYFGFPGWLKLVGSDLLGPEAVEELPDVALFPRDRQVPFEHLFKNKASLPECPETGISEKVMEFQFLIVSPKRGKVWDLPSMGDQVCH